MPTKVTKIFITGGLGYLGSHLAKEAVKAGHQVVLYDSLAYEQGRIAMQKEIGNAELIVGDTRNIDLLRKSLIEHRPDYVCHFAEFASVYACNHNPVLTEDVNYNASKGVLKLCEDLKIKVIYNSSSSVYGIQKGDRIMKETDEVPSPTDNYVKHKLLMEKYIKSRPKLNIILFRPATVFGISPRMRIDLMPNHFTYMAKRSGVIKIFDPNAYRAGIDIDELTRAYLLVMKKGKWKHLMYNIGQYNMRKIDFAKGVQAVIPCKIGSSSDVTDPRSLQIDCSRFNDEFLFKPHDTYGKSVKKVEKWVESHPNIGLPDLTMPLSEWERMCS